MFAVSSPIPLPNPAAFEDKLLVKKHKRQLDTPTTPKCPSTPLRSPYPQSSSASSHFYSTSHLHSHQPRVLSFCFDLATDTPTKTSSSSSSMGISLTPNVHNDSMKNKGCLTELKRCNRSEQYTIVSLIVALCFDQH